MSNIKTTYGKIETQCVEYHGFGLLDYKGREIGARVTLQIREMVPVDTNEPFYSGFAMEPGTYFAFTPVATRGGEAFGAFSGSRYFKTEATRAAALRKYLDGAKKRAAKTAGK